MSFDCLDIQGQRELLAGIELEAGPQAAALARCNARVGSADRYGMEQAKRADEADKTTIVVGAITSIASAIAAALTTWAITRAVDTVPHPVNP